MSIEITLEPEPVVLADCGEHVAMWSVGEAWSCSCDHTATRANPSCAHVVQAARELLPGQALRLVQARREAGLGPTREQILRDQRTTPAKHQEPHDV